MPLSLVGFAWLLGDLGPLGMNDCSFGAIHGGEGVHFWGSPVNYSGRDAHGECVLLSPYGTCMLLCGSGCLSLFSLLWRLRV